MPLPVSERFDRIRARFREVFGGAEAEKAASAPGRVNLIGEHTDYNDGYVFPMAIGHRVDVAGRRRDDARVRLVSLDYDAEARFSLAEPIAFDEAHRWSNYLRGVFAELQREGVALGGVELVFTGDVPLGAGLSSSAALEVATARLLCALFDVERTERQLARLCQRAENDFVGNRCGIMDPFISLLGRRDHALLIDCRSLDYALVPLDLAGHHILVCDSGVRHTLVDSAYNERREQCEAGVAILAERIPKIRALRDVTAEQLEVARAELPPTVHRRCTHVVAENDRVLASRAALEAGDLAGFGRAMNASHDSLRDDYEVSCPEVDALVGLARALPGVLGARITGGGFGGCTVNLVTGEAAARFPEAVLSPYRERTGKEPRLFVSAAADGAVVE